MEAQVDLLFYFEETTGFTALEQGTGYLIAIIAAAIARGCIQPGVIELENAMSGTDFVKQAAKRAFQVKLDVRKASKG